MICIGNEVIKKEKLMRKKNKKEKERILHREL